MVQRYPWLQMAELPLIQSVILETIFRSRETLVDYNVLLNRDRQVGIGDCGLAQFKFSISAILSPVF